MYSRQTSPAVGRRGKIMMLIVVGLIPVVGSVAVALEGGLLLDLKRHMQAAADAAALASGDNLYDNYLSNSGSDPNGQAVTAALAAAARNGYANDGVRCMVTVNIPPKTGDHVGKPGYAEVVIQYNQPRFFSRVLGSADTVVQVRSVGRGLWAASRNGILVLDLATSEALKCNGTGTVIIRDADIIVDSNNPQSVASDGQGSTIQLVNCAAQLSGGVKSNTIIQGPVNYNQPPTPDPLAYLPYPPKPTLTLSSTGVKPDNPSVARFLSAMNLSPSSVNGRVYILGNRSLEREE
jgi:hypothetical protein